MEMHEERLGEVTVVRIAGRLDAVSAQRIRDKVKACIQSNQLKLVFELSEVDFVDSSGLGSLVASLRSLNRMGGDLKLAGLQDRVRAIFELIRLNHVFEIFGDGSSAVGSYAKPR